MKRKISKFLVVVLLLHTIPLLTISEFLGVINEVRAESTNTITKNDIEKFDGMIAVGLKHSVVLKEDGTVYGVGDNTEGQLNIKDWKDISKVYAGDYHTVGLKKDGTVVAVGSNENGQLNIEGWSDIVHVAVGGSSIIGLKKDGTVVAVGANTYGQLNVENWTDIVQVSASSRYTVGLRKDGTVVATGKGIFQQLDVSSWKGIVQVSASSSYIIGLKDDGTIVGVRDHSSGQAIAGSILNWKDIVQISEGYPILGLKKDGTVVKYGSSSHGDFNVEEWSNIVQVSGCSSHALGLRSNGTIISSGKNNYYGELNIGSWNDIVQIAAGHSHTVGLKKDGTVVATGDNERKQINVTNWKDIVQVSAGDYHTVGLKKDGTVVATGRDNYYRELNVVEWKDIVQVSVGDYHTVGLKRDGTVVATGGNNEYGELNVGEWKDIVQVSAGEYHTVGLKKDGTVVAVGKNHYGQIDIGEWKDIVQVSAGGSYIGSYTAGLKKDGTVVTTGYILNDKFKDIKNWKDIVQVSVEGNEHAVGLKNDGTVVATGFNQYGQLGIGEWKDIIEISVGHMYTVGLKKDGTVVGVGGNWYGQIDVESNSGTKNILSDKGIYKIGEVANIIIKNNNRFYDFTNLAAEINGETYDLKKISKDEYLLEYKCDDSGDKSVKIIGSKDVFNKELISESLFKVIPIKSITTSSTKVTNGQKITINTIFTERVNNNFTVNLSGAINYIGMKLEEVPGSGGTKFIASYTIPNTNNLGDVNITIKKLEDSSGTYYNTYTENNVFSKVESNEEPVITAEDITLKVGDVFKEKEGVSASDTEDGDISDKIVVKENKVDTSKVGVYKVVYEVTDKDENKVTKEINVTVRSNEKPVINASDVTLKVGDKFEPLKEVSAIDKEDGEITKIEVKGDKVDTSKVGEYKVIYEVTDKDGNTVSKEIKVTVETSEGSDWKTHWARNEIKYAMEKGWINTTDKFRPNDSITRAEFIKIVNKAFGYNTAAKTENFTDVEKGDWWYNEVLIALNRGYITSNNETFRPSDSITREEVAAIITSIKKNKDGNLDKIKKLEDFDKISNWAQTSVEGAVEAGYMGKGGAKFRPKDSITRAEAVVTLYRVVK